MEYYEGEIGTGLARLSVGNIRHRSMETPLGDPKTEHCRRRNREQPLRASFTAEGGFLPDAQERIIRAYSLILRAAVGMEGESEANAKDDVRGGTFFLC